MVMNKHIHLGTGELSALERITLAAAFALVVYCVFVGVPDRERGALKRLAAIMKGYPDLVPYVQGDPRGAPLYICSKAYIGNQPIESMYNGGVAVYK
jgi:hypothetical protein